MAAVCCYCKRPIVGPVRFHIPPGYPRNPAHDDKPLCEGCGGEVSPTLDEICEFLDREISNPDRCPRCNHGKHDGTCGLIEGKDKRCLCQEGVTP